VNDRSYDLRGRRNERFVYQIDNGHSPIVPSARVGARSKGGWP
jgi:hypothetical protein